MQTQKQVTENNSNKLGNEEKQGVDESILSPADTFPSSSKDVLEETFRDFCEIFGIGGTDEKN